MTRVHCFQVDAFTIEPFGGNPAAVVCVDRDYPDEWYQIVAREMNLSETAFIRQSAEGYSLRWFTPTVEVDLCGHATLAAAHVIWRELDLPDTEPIQFQTRSGILTASYQGAVIELDFPATVAEPANPPEELLEVLGVEHVDAGRSHFDWLIVVEREALVHSLDPDPKRLAKIPSRGVMFTSQTDEGPYDFVSRFFAPAVGVNEDPVTGSAHCCLGPYWAARLGKQSLVGYQASPRGGEVHMRMKGDRVVLGGQAVTVMRGEWIATPPADNSGN